MKGMQLFVLSCIVLLLRFPLFCYNSAISDSMTITGQGVTLERLIQRNSNHEIHRHGLAYCTKTLYNMGGKVETFGPVCQVQKFCNGMQWPVLTDEVLADDERNGSNARITQHACPLCLYGYILPAVPQEFEGTPMDFCALLPPEFYPCPFPVLPRDGSGPPRAGPCWEPIINGTRLNYTGTGVVQSWPRGYDYFAETEEKAKRKSKKRIYANRQVKVLQPRRTFEEGLD
ncbi:hypothetical protein GUITHDRAFT_135634 [Guillardia theta CCMP2712]|uniref:Uncharacterized protein n=1 Tax=Guillardia theta (strain CCMP2712) TaxID=905079 RepID=L1JNC4_GUITC|nr:hypothetical protein GUITHDRAFT_135634 [Guillardia theta CCMP2712]EKX49947.1 hypothetical protein GUITHDRAFT_135634 [Guillardia theta CCMP2712]|eukprot:XP_005836927.1 hypothetical protein GUITHDRAFT_135634 [Guillardia theta CCMP2712]